MRWASGGRFPAAPPLGGNVELLVLGEVIGDGDKGIGYMVLWLLLGSSRVSGSLKGGDPGK